MRIPAKTDYALRAVAELGAAAADEPVKAEAIAASGEIPLRFLENILSELRHAGVVESRRGADGGYLLARPAAEIPLAEVIRAVDGPLANIGGTRPEALEYPRNAASLRDVWVAVRASLRDVLERVTVADLASGAMPDAVATLTSRDDAWHPH